MCTNHALVTSRLQHKCQESYLFERMKFEFEF